MIFGTNLRLKMSNETRCHIWRELNRRVKLHSLQISKYFEDVHIFLKFIKDPENFLPPSFHIFTSLKICYQ